MKSPLTLGIAQVSSPFDRELFLKGTEVLKALGFNLFFEETIFEKKGYLSGSDRDRAERLMELFANPKVDAVLFARGGYGSQRMIPHLDPKTFRQHPKPTVGFSDLTPLLAWLHQTCGVPIFYGPVVTSLGKPHAEEMEESLYRALTTPALQRALPMGEAKTLQPGEAEGKFVGGCLSLITSSIGTSYELDLRDAILFVEEIDEKIYAMDRMLTQLKNAGKLRSCRGIVAGTLIPRSPSEPSINDMLRDCLSDFRGPIIVDYPAGHTEQMITLPLGREVELHAPEKGSPSLHLVESV